MRYSKRKIITIGVIFIIIAILISAVSDFIYLISSDIQHDAVLKEVFVLGFKIIILLIMLVIHIMFVLHKKTKILKDQNQRFEALTANILGGVVCCENDEFLTIKYLSDGFLKLTGFSREEIAINFNNQYIKMIYPKDRIAMFNQIKDNSNRVFEMQYKLIRKDGIIIWILDKGQLVVDKDEKNMIYSVMVDITNLKRTEKELEKNRHELLICSKQYQIITNQIECIVFDYNYEDDVVIFSSAYKRKLGYLPPCEDFPYSFIDENIVHHDDCEKFKEFCQAIINGEKEHDNIYRLINSDSKYLPCSIHFNTIYDENNAPVKAIGRIAVNYNDKY